MPLHRIGTGGDRKCQKRGDYIEIEKLFLNLSGIKVLFSELKGYLAKRFP